jgi:2'-deoxynucleoside 5'-phosphate N-hydrolase
VRVYLACTVRGDRTALGAARAIREELQRSGHEILTAHLLNDDVEAAEAGLTEAEVFERDLAWLDACDLLVAEASGSTFGVGFEVGYIVGRADRTGQRAVLCYAADRHDRVSRLIAGNVAPCCRVIAYRGVDDLREAIRAAVADAAASA